MRVEAATTCGTDVKMWRRGHPILPPYPARFGHETAGVRLDTGERVLVGDSVACGACRACAAGRPQICRDPRWVLGGFAELIAAPEAALHAVPAGWIRGRGDGRAAGGGGPRVARAPRRARPGRGVLGGGPMGQMLAALLVAEGRTSTLPTAHAERRAQAAALSAMTAERLADHDVVFEAVGRPEAWRAAIEATRRAAASSSSAAAPAAEDAALPTRPLHYDELDLRGAFHHSPAEVDRRCGRWPPARWTGGRWRRRPICALALRRALAERAVRRGSGS